MSWWTNLIGTVQKDEQWIASELAKGWHLLQTVGHTIQIDAVGIETWIQKNHAGTIALFNGFLKDVEAIGGLIPGAQPYVAAATVAIDAATALADSLSKSVLAGSTPLSTLTNTYHAFADARTAVTAVLKQGTTKPSA